MFGKFYDPISHWYIHKSWIISLHQLITSHFGGTPLVILVDLLNGSTGVEGVIIFLAVDELSETLDGVIGRDAIVGIGNSFYL